MNKFLNNLLLVLVVASSLVSLSACGAPQSVLTKPLLIAAEQSNGVSETQTSQPFVTRITKNIIERQIGDPSADPYQLTLPNYAHSKEEVWILEIGDSLQTRMRRLDKQGKLVLDTQSVKSGNSVRRRINDLLKGIDVVSEAAISSNPGGPTPNPSPRWFENLSDKAFQVSEITESDWKRSAWKVTLERDISNGGSPNFPQIDLAIGLHATTLKYIWIIDKESLTTITAISTAVTNKGDVLLQQINVDQPRAVSVNSLPSDWFTISSEKAFTSNTTPKE